MATSSSLAPSLYCSNRNTPSPRHASNTSLHRQQTNDTMESLGRKLSKLSFKRNRGPGHDNNAARPRDLLNSNFALPTQPSFTQEARPITPREVMDRRRQRERNQAPPPYSPAANAPPASPPSDGGPVSDDNRYAFLRVFDTVLLIDDSGSMWGPRWREAQAAIEALSPIVTQYDGDGIDIYFLNARDSPHFRNVRCPGTVREIFQTVSPSGETLLGTRLNSILKPYLDAYAAAPHETKPLNILCITDGRPNDEGITESVIAAAAAKLDRLDAPAWQCGVQFVQIGDDPHAREFLASLDDDIRGVAGAGPVRDIVDTMPFTGAMGGRLSGEGLLKVVLGAVNKRWDRKADGDLYQR